MERSAAPPLLPVLRSRQQGDILAFLLGEPDRECSLTELATSLAVPAATVHREIERAERSGLVVSRKDGVVRRVRANTDSPYFSGLADVLVKAFGPPRVVSEALSHVEGIDAAYLFGSWVARYAGMPGTQPVGDIDLLVLGSPDRDVLYAAAHDAEARLGRALEITFRDAGWLEFGSGSFHDTVVSRPLLEVLPHLDLAVIRMDGAHRSQ